MKKLLLLFVILVSSFISFASVKDTVRSHYTPKPDFKNEILHQLARGFSNQNFDSLRPYMIGFVSVNVKKDSTFETLLVEDYRVVEYLRSLSLNVHYQTYRILGA